MTAVAEVARWLEEFAPARLAESWDNVGLIWGDPGNDVERVMTCLTVTQKTALEAVHERAELIVSHHPVLFRPVQRIRADRPETGALWTLARAGVSVLSPHTAFDNTAGGINDGLAGRLGLRDVHPLRPGRTSESFKIVVFTPESDHEAVLAAAFGAGAGRIGAYHECSFAIPGRGTFYGGEETNPTVGQAGRRETVNELRVEVVCPTDRLAPVLAAIRAAHSYEEPAIDVHPLHPSPHGPGAGRVGRLPHTTTLRALAAQVGQLLKAPGLQAVGDPERAVARLAVVCGAGDDFLHDAARAGADALLTGEARFHRALEAEALGVGLIVAGHHATERPGVEDLATRITRAFPDLDVWPSRSEADPLWNGATLP
ncbi:MAG: Nif3-like dinuclear metal center hexameric protein [Isosphaeraceae bacterium]|nr:Nif3-like dinuclear metal center hexameric protein [Isosphaeraceae bacterium]